MHLRQVCDRGYKMLTIKYDLINGLKYKSHILIWVIMLKFEIIKCTNIKIIISYINLFFHF